MGIFGGAIILPATDARSRPNPASLASPVSTPGCGTKNERMPSVVAGSVRSPGLSWQVWGLYVRKPQGGKAGPEMSEVGGARTRGPEGPRTLNQLTRGDGGLGGPSWPFSKEVGNPGFYVKSPVFKCWQMIQNYEKKPATHTHMPAPTLCVKSHRTPLRPGEAHRL